MARPLSFIEDITPTSKPDWRVRVVVLEKHHPRLNAASPQKSNQLLILCDSKGVRVQAIIWGSNISKFNNSLLLGRHYIISNAFVKIILPQYQIVPNSYRWSIANHTLIEEVAAPEGPNPTPNYKFTPYANFPEYLNVPMQIDVIGIVLDMAASGQLTTSQGPSVVQQAILINQELIPTLVNFLGPFVHNECAALGQQLDQNPIIIALRMNVIAYNGLSLSTNNLSAVLISPDHPDAVALKDWYFHAKDQIANKFRIKNYFSLASDTIPVVPEEISTVADAITMPLNTTIWVRACMKIVNGDQPFWYKACSNCKNSTSAPLTETFTCNDCQSANAISTARCTAQVEVTDPTGKITAFIYEKDAEALLSCTAAELVQATTNLATTFIERTSELALKNQYLLKINACQRRYQGTVVKKYIIYYSEIMPFLKEPQLEQATEQMITSTNDDKNNTSCQHPSPLPKVEQQDCQPTKASPSAVIHANEEQICIEEAPNPLEHNSSADTWQTPSSS